MRPVRIAVSGLLCLVALVLVLRALSDPSPSAPRFVPLLSPPVGTYTRMDYDWGGAVPVQDGKVWIETWSSRTNWHCFLYDVTNRLIVGELFNATPIFFNHDRTKLLCEGYSLKGVWKWRLSRWLQKFPLTKPLAQKINRVEAFWVLDLKDRSAKAIGSVSQFPGSGSRFLPSPGFRFGAMSPTWPGTELFVCDLASNLFTRFAISGYLVGWWDAHTLLVRDEGSNFVLRDVITHQTNVLFSTEATSKLLVQMGLPGSSYEINTHCNWNGREYDFFFGLGREMRWGKSFLLKLDRNDRTLKLVKRNFKFQHLGFFDAAGTHYLYEGESGTPGSGGNGGVFLRDLSDDSVRTLVPPDNAGQYSLARFCGDGVIYSRNRVLWRVDLDGSNNVPLFRPNGGR